MMAAPIGLVTTAFFYGSLQAPEVIATLLGASQVHRLARHARVKGFTRKRVKGEMYPAAVPGAPTDIITGILFDIESQAEAQLLDQYEGPSWEKAIVQAEATRVGTPLIQFDHDAPWPSDPSDTVMLKVTMYTFTGSPDQLDDVPWTYHGFRSHIDDYVMLCEEFMRSARADDHEIFITSAIRNKYQPSCDTTAPPDETHLR